MPTTYGRKSLNSLSFSSNSDYIAAAFDDNSVQVHFRLRVIAGSISHTITKHKSQVYGLEFSKTGEYLATVSTDGELKPSIVKTSGLTTVPIGTLG